MTNYYRLHGFLKDEIEYLDIDGEKKRIAFDENGDAIVDEATANWYLYMTGHSGYTVEKISE